MINQRIRRLARKQGLTASKSRRDGLWRFANKFNYLESPEAGLDDEEALEYLAQDAGGKPKEAESLHILRDLVQRNTTTQYNSSANAMNEDVYEKTVSQEHRERLAMINKGYENLVDFYHINCVKNLFDGEMYTSSCRILCNQEIQNAIGMGLNIESAEIASAIALRIRIRENLYEVCEDIEQIEASS